MLTRYVFDQVIQRLSLHPDPRWMQAGLWLLDRAIPQTAEGLGLLREYAHAPQPLARYLAARRLGRFSTPDDRAEVWSLLQALALDPQRLVREGAAWGLSAFLVNDPANLSLLCRALNDPATPPLLCRAILLSTLPIIRNKSAERLDAALEVIKIVLHQTWPQGTGVKIVVVQELARQYPEQAMTLIEDWVKSDPSISERQVVRMLTPTLKERFPERAGLVSGCIRQIAATPQTTADIPVPVRLIDQIIGQDRAVEIIKLAARQRRFVLLVGEPGTGKSLLAAAMAEMMPATGLEDLMVRPNHEGHTLPRVERVPAGQGMAMLRNLQTQQQQAAISFNYLFWLAVIATIFISGFFSFSRNSPWVAVGGVITIILLFVARWWLARGATHAPLPKLLVNNRYSQTAPFIDATGFHAGALLGDVRHDPFQSGGFETAPHELVEPGAIHLAHGGVLFIDEASTLRIESQQSLLTAIQERRFPISGRSLGSSGAMVRTEPVPCDFVLVLAGNREDVARMHPALRSRMRGYGYEVYLHSTMPDTPQNQAKLRQFVAQEVRKDGRIPPFSCDAIEALIEEARKRSDKVGQLTARLRELGGLIRAAGDIAIHAGATVVLPEHILAAHINALTLEEQFKEDQ